MIDKIFAMKGATLFKSLTRSQSELESYFTTLTESGPIKTLDLKINMTEFSKMKEPEQKALLVNL